MKKVSLMDVKVALRDGRFRDALPLELQDEIAGFLKDPGCACNVPLYRKILKSYRKELSKYFPGREIANEEEEIQKLAENHWTVINCSVDELASRLKKLPPGRKQLDVARFEDQVTVVVNELDIIY